MFNYPDLEKRYKTNAAFNKATNLFRQLIQEFGFMPSEIREALFLAQYMFEMDTVSQVVRSKAEWEQIAKLNEQLKATFVTQYERLQEEMTKSS
jgi:hypothetical protein